MLQLKIGHRVFHKATGQAGFVTSAATSTGWNRGLVTVTLEGKHTLRGLACFSNSPTDQLNS